MASLTVAVFGLAETQAALRKSVPGLTQKVDAEIQYAGIACQRYAKQLCPVDTGRLRSSIQYVNTGQGSCMVDTNTFYAIFLEFGTSKMAARPFLRPAYEKARTELIANLKALRM